ncbi:hypothetical protein [Nonomuraea basaltis]|uniref:hypothetical protein n=1 Tax=Nonomuraea basaltis TaxID=2495887 RepID=UPI00110C49DD|nr:hypothetical protein [Nonomuraea basaltis]TMS00220.1 hypothetical protein EJK15_03855 [Nonomuraea basaltis]
MDPTESDHFATITTPAGSVVHFPFLTGQEAGQIAQQYGPPTEPLPPHIEAGKDKQPCGKCGGQGHWYETVEVESPSGSKVTTQKRVNCRTCGGTGSIPK